MRNYLIGILGFTMIIAMVACGGSGGGGGNGDKPTLNQDQFEAAITDLGQDIGKLTTSLQNDDAVTALGQLPSNLPLNLPFGPVNLADLGQTMVDPRAALEQLRHSDLSPQADENLPRGVYVYNDDIGDWELSDPSDDLILQWNYVDYDESEIKTASATLDWDARSPTVEVNQNALELPTGMTFSMIADGTEVAQVVLSADWYDAAVCGGLIGEPIRLNIDGNIGAVDIDNAGFSITDTAGTSDSISTSGKVSADADGDSASIEWNLSADGTLVRGEDCFLMSFENISAASFSVSLSETVAGDSSSLALSFDIDAIVYSDSGEVVSAQISDGIVRIDGDIAVTFAGTFDDENANGVPGENIVVRFADGSTTTLEALLMSDMGYASLDR